MHQLARTPSGRRPRQLLQSGPWGNSAARQDATAAAPRVQSSSGSARGQQPPHGWCRGARLCGGALSGVPRPAARRTGSATGSATAIIAVPLHGGSATVHAML